MKFKRTMGSILFDMSNYAFMFLLMIVMLYPMLNVLALSLSSSSAIDAGLVTWFPNGFNLSGYQYIMKDTELLLSYLWTIAYAFGGTLFTLSFTSMIAFSLAQPDFVLKKAVTMFLTLTMFIGGGLIPTFVLMKQMNLFNTYWVMVLPGCVSAYTTFVFRTFFQGIPHSLTESSRIDGANDIVIWARIVLPLSKPLLATYFLFSMVGHWNSWFGAMLYLTDKSRHPLQMVLRRLVVLDNLVGQSGAADAAIYATSFGMHAKNAQMAAVFIAMAPILIIYPFIQKYFAKGVMIGAIKG